MNRNHKNNQVDTFGFGEPCSEPTRTRASARANIRLEKKPKGPLRKKSPRKDSANDGKFVGVVGIVERQRFDIPKVIRNGYRSPPFNRFYMLALAFLISLLSGGYFGWEYATRQVTAKIESFSESPKLHSWFDKVTNKKSHQIKLGVRKSQSGAKPKARKERRKH